MTSTKQPRGTVSKTWHSICATQSRVILAVALLISSIGVYAQEPKENVSEDELNQLEEVVVTAVRLSLKKSLDVKRDSIGVVDAIISEDIAQFPDLNIGEALQRVPGITLNRNLSGEGRRISIRGLSPSFVQTTLNGITAAPAGDTGGNLTRSFDFDTFASELFQSVTVNKTNSADLPDGGLAGTVDLRTPKPLDYDSNKLVLYGASQFAEQGGEDGNDFDDWQPRISGLASFINEDKTLGFLISAAYSDTTVRGDISEGFRYSPTGAAFLTNTLNGNDRQPGTADDFTQADIDAAGTMINGSPATLAQLQDIAANTVAPTLPRVGPQVENRERLGITTSFQARPTDDLEFGVDVLYAEYDDDRLRATLDGLTGFGRRGVVPVDLQIENDVLIAGTLDNISQRTETVAETFETDFLHVTADAKWDFDDDKSIYAQLGRSESEEDELRLTYLWDFFGQFNFDMRDAAHPRFSGTGFDPNDVNDFSPVQNRLRPRSRKTDEDSIRLDFEWLFDGASFRKLKTGVRYVQREAEQRRGEIRPTNTGAAADFLVPLPVDDFLSDAPAGTPTSYLIVDIDRAISLFEGITVPVDFNGTYTIEEDVFAAYIKTEWQFNDVFVDFGVRYATTDQKSIGSQLAGGAPEPVEFSNNYNNFLPSLNLRWNIRDDLVARFSANRGITRPTLGNLSPGVVVTNPTTRVANAGNPMLEPFEADQYDVSLEWYFNEESLLALTVFYKDVKSFIENGIVPRVLTGSNLTDDDGNNISGETFFVNQPINGDEGELKGVELVYQQPFTMLPQPFDGLGVQANVTVSDSEATRILEGERVRRELAGQSDLTYNLTAYYEKGPVSVRLSWSYRDDHLDTFDSGLASLERRWDERGQLDLAIRYAINDRYTIKFDAININDENAYSFNRNRSLNRTHFDQGPVYSLGIRAELY